MSKTKGNYVITNSCVNLLMEDGSVYTIDNTNLNYNAIRQALARNDYRSACELADIPLFIQTFTDGNFKSDLRGGIEYQGEALPQTLANHLIDLAKAGHDYQYLINFWKAVKANPSEESRQSLYDFLVHNKVRITKDGKFIAWKGVNKNMTDKYTGKVQYAIGVPTVFKRKDVDSNRNVGCSYGLHAGSFEYAKSYAGDDVLMEVEIDPKDVVSVPTDCNFQKLRVCKLLPIRVVGKVEPAKSVVRKDVLAVLNKEKDGTFRISRSSLNGEYHFSVIVINDDLIVIPDNEQPSHCVDIRGCLRISKKWYKGSSLDNVQTANLYKEKRRIGDKWRECLVLTAD